MTVLEALCPLYIHFHNLKDSKRSVAYTPYSAFLALRLVYRVAQTYASLNSETKSTANVAVIV